MVLAFWIGRWYDTAFLKIYSYFCNILNFSPEQLLLENSFLNIPPEQLSTGLAVDSSFEKRRK